MIQRARCRFTAGCWKFDGLHFSAFYLHLVRDVPHFLSFYGKYGNKAPTFADADLENGFY